MVGIYNNSTVVRMQIVDDLIDSEATNPYFGWCTMCIHQEVKVDVIILWIHIIDVPTATVAYPCLIWPTDTGDASLDFYKDLSTVIGFSSSYLALFALLRKTDASYDTCDESIQNESKTLGKLVSHRKIPYKIGYDVSNKIKSIAVDFNFVLSSAEFQ